MNGWGKNYEFAMSELLHSCLNSPILQKFLFVLFLKIVRITVETQIVLNQILDKNLSDKIFWTQGLPLSNRPCGMCVRVSVHL